MDLCDALDVRPGEVTALVGGGGKTTALYRLGDELAARGRPVLLCGTTRFTPPEGRAPPNLVLVGGPAELRGAVAAGNWPVTVATDWGSKGRLLPVEPGWIDALHHERPDLTVVIEADGSAMRPFKAPGDHEPVVPRSASLVVCVAGVDAAGRPLDETHVHRPERVAALTGATVGGIVTPELIAAVLCHPEGGRKGVPAGARWVALLNKADTPARRRVAELVAGALRDCAAPVVIAQVKRGPPVVAVLPAVV
jgi:probable selenium-dependent hydroxylase accessory protein YqeC